ncbi:MAG: cytochrome c-type biogenesis protein [Sphingomonadaceae bacterium]
MRWLIALLFLFAAPAWAQLEMSDVPLEDPRQEAAARDLMGELRCLQCQNQSIGDSNAGQASTMRAIVRQRIAAGESPEQVRAFFIERYGDWVSFKPPPRPDTWLLWATPVLALLVGGLVAFRLFRRRS